VLRRRYVRRLLSSMALNGVSTGVALSIILLVHRGASFGAAGAAAAAFAVCGGVASPLRGRAVDRFGQTKVLSILGSLRVSALLALVLVARGGSGALPLIALAGVGGATEPPLGSALRALWRSLVEPEDLTTAYSLHSVMNELGFIVGPATAGLLAAALGPSVGLATIALIEFSGTVCFLLTRASRRWEGAPGDAGALGAMRSAGFRLLALVNIPIGMVFGALDVAAPAVALRHGDAWASGFAITTLAAASVVGGLFYGSHTWRAPANQRLFALLCLMSIAFIPLAFAVDVPSLIVSTALAGFTVSPVVATVFQLIDHVAPTGTATEAMSWVISLYSVGIATGAALGGALVTPHLRVVLASCAVSSALAALVAGLGLRVMARAELIPET
jgi:MFS family permease